MICLHQKRLHPIYRNIPPDLYTLKTYPNFLSIEGELDSDNLHDLLNCTTLSSSSIVQAMDTKKHERGKNKIPAHHWVGPLGPRREKK